MKTLLALLTAVLMVGGGAMALPSLKAYLLSEPLPPMEAAVMVYATDAVGSGIHIGGGQILTAAHVVEDEKTVTIKNEAGTFIEGVKVIWRDKVLDVAMLQTEPASFAVSAPLDCSPNVIGQRVTLVGAPLGIVLMFTRGSIISTAFLDRGILDATGLNGMSGGGVINADGHTVGIISAVFRSGDDDGEIAAFTVMIAGASICDRMAQE